MSILDRNWLGLAKTSRFFVEKSGVEDWLAKLGHCNSAEVIVKTRFWRADRIGIPPAPHGYRL